MDEETAYLYVLVRTDLSFPQQAVQACHAAIESTRQFPDPHSEHPYLVLCGVPDVNALTTAKARLEASGVPLAAFYEPDQAGSLTAVATRPLRGPERLPMRKYQCLRA